MQITKKYKISTKYDDNLRLYQNRESRKTPFVLLTRTNIPKDKGQQEREQKANNSSH